MSAWNLFLRLKRFFERLLVEFRFNLGDGPIRSRNVRFVVDDDVGLALGEIDRCRRQRDLFLLGVISACSIDARRRSARCSITLRRSAKASSFAFNPVTRTSHSSICASASSIASSSDVSPSMAVSTIS